MNTHVLAAVFRRNFVSYFANPTGYVFICLFVLLGAIAAFWVPEFFNNNLANLDQLSYWFPFIMLVYIPTITMSIWAEERKQGTDELLLTIPAGDFDIVLGKYLAVVAIYSVSLLFSLICNLAVLDWLGEPDGGLLLANYIGYWFVGLAMLAIGVVASFLTSNITIAFVLGVLFNMPLVFLASIDAVFGALGQERTLAIKNWSIAHQFEDFGRGVLSLAGVGYFLWIVAVMLYISMVLIGRRHWPGEKKRRVMFTHYLLRTLALCVFAVAAVTLLGQHDLRADISSEQLSSLAPQTRQLLRELEVKRPVEIEAFISPVVPESYVQTRLNLLTMLREFEALGGEKVRVRVHHTDRFSNEAALAEKRYGIEPKQVTTLNRGVLSSDYIFLHVAVGCGTRKIPPVFIDRGIPIEYELIRSLCTVSQEKRERVGVLNTDAQLYGGFDFQTMGARANWPIIDELEKQYEVVRVDASKPIERFDVLLAVQPSSLGPEEFGNFLAAVRSGQPTAIFEDPAPVFCPSVPATSAQRQPPGMNPFIMRMQPLPKGDIVELWELLGVDFPVDQVVWQAYNPYPKAGHFPPEFVFIDYGCGAKQPFNPRSPISSGLQHMLFPFPGFLEKLHSSEMEFIPLARSGSKTGTVAYREILQMTPFGGRSGLNPDRRQVPTGLSYVLAAWIRGKVKSEATQAAPEKAAEEEKGNGEKEKAATTSSGSGDDLRFTSQVEAAVENKAENKTAAETRPTAHEQSEPKPEQPAETAPAGAEQQEQKKETTEEESAPEKPRGKSPAENTINVVLVADIDMLSQDFFRLREQGEVPEAGIYFDFDNVTFVLNVLDELAGDRRFIDIRKRRLAHRTLTRIEERTEQARAEAAEAREEFIKQYEKLEKQEEDTIQEKLAELQKRKNVDVQQMAIELSMMKQDLERRKEAKLEQARRQRDREIQKSQTALNLHIKRVQDQYKLWAVVLPPIPPLVVAAIVFFTRRIREQEGVARSRLR